VSNQRFVPVGTGWEFSVFGFLGNFQTVPPIEVHDRLSDYFTVDSPWTPKLDKVTINGQPMIRATFERPLPYEVYLDPAHGYAIRGMAGPKVRGVFVSRSHVERLLATDAGIYYPALIRSEFTTNRRQRSTVRIVSASANVQDLPENFFTMQWPAELGPWPVWDQDAKKSFYPGRGQTSTTSPATQGTPR
jgi:hypothetical protein